MSGALNRCKTAQLNTGQSALGTEPPTARPMTDPYGRRVSGLRISLTANCNLRCLYCHNEGLPPSTAEMSPEEIGKIAEIAASLGIKEIKLTGGEPLLRGDIAEILRLCAKWMDEISMTTNGTLLAPKAQALRDAGLKRVNVSMDTLDPERYAALTGSDALEQVMEGIRSAIHAGLQPVKVNIVAISEFSVEEIVETIEGAWAMGATPQLIEPIGWHSRMEAVETYLCARARAINNGARRKICVMDKGRVEMVKVHSSAFCAGCTRLRVTSDGRLKPCLMHNEGLVDILSLIRNGAGEQALSKAFEKAVESRRPWS
ncbi:MAG: GTP 3',8-cyclase MoaA [Candidatus Thermoplasmatota archaeon]